MPFEEDSVLRMGHPEKREVNRTYTAETGGLLYGYIEVKKDGDRGSLKIYSPGEGQKQLCAAASVFRSPPKSWIMTRVSCNSVFFPVANGATYRVDKNGSATPHVYWTPILSR